MLACVIFGHAPESLKNQLYDSLDGIRIEYSNQIADFDGDTSDLEGVDSLLEPLLQLELKESGPSEPKAGGPWILWIIVVAALAYFAYNWVSKESKQSVVERYLRDAPGIAVTTTFWEDQKLVVEGLKDPDASVPFKTLEAHGIEKDDIVLKTIPFRSLELDMELQRFRDEFSLPSGVYLSKRDQGICLLYTSPSPRDRG